MLGLACMLLASVIGRSRAFASLGKLSRRASPLVTAFSLSSNRLSQSRPANLASLYMSSLSTQGTVLSPKPEPVEYFRKDYVPPSYVIPEIFLAFKLDPSVTHVVATSQVQRKVSTVEDLILDGEDLKLLGVKINGVPVTDYELSPGKLRIKKEVIPNGDFSLEVHIL